MIQRAVPADDPADIAGPVGAQQRHGAPATIGAELALDPRHRADHARAGCGVQLLQLHLDVGLGARVEVGKGVAAFGRQRDIDLPLVARRRRPGNDLALLQPQQQPAELPRIDVEIFCQLSRTEQCPVCQLVDHACFGQ